MTFADRAARRHYGRRGVSRGVEMGSYVQDMSLAEFSSFIGIMNPIGQTTGHTFHFTVSAA